MKFRKVLKFLFFIEMVTPDDAFVVSRKLKLSSCSDVKCGKSSMENTMNALPSNLAACSIGLTKN